MSTFYKIQSKRTGLFSTGGQDPGWSTIGKVWPVRGHLTSHFTGLSSLGRRTYHDHDAQVVECHVEVLQGVPFTEFVDAAKARKDARCAAAKARLEAAERSEY